MKHQFQSVLVLAKGSSTHTKTLMAIMKKLLICCQEESYKNTSGYVNLHLSTQNYLTPAEIFNVKVIEAFLSLENCPALN